MQRILVVDDDPAVTSVLRRGLAYEGYAVQTAASGEEALTAARERYPDLVVLDILMPGISGLTVLERLRAADAQLPVLLLTAKDTPADEVEGLERGADDYVVKPFEFDVLLARVREFATLSVIISGRAARRGVGGAPGRLHAGGSGRWPSSGCPVQP